MTPLITALLIAGGVSLAAGGVHLSIALRRKEDLPGFFFAVVCFAAAAGAMLDAGILRAADPAVLTSLLKWQAAVQGILWTALAWFVVFHGGVPNRWPAWAATGAFVLALVVNLASPAGIFHRTIELLPPVALPWGERIAHAAGGANPLRILFDIGWGLMVWLTASSCLRLQRRGPRERAVMLAVGVLPWAGIAHLQGALVQVGIAGPPPLWSAAFLAMILILGASLTGGMVRASEASRAVAADEGRWRLVMENLPRLVVAMDRDKRITYANPGFLEITGVSGPEAAGRRFLEFVAEKDRGPALERFQRALNGRTRSRYPAALVRPDGNEARIAWFTLAVQSDSGATTGLISVGRDVTAREAARKAHAEALSALRETAGRLASENAALQEALARERAERERMEREGLARERVQAAPVPEEVPADAAPLPPMEEVERRHIEEALKRASGRIGGPGGAADLLGMNPSTLRSRMKRCGVERP